MKKNTNNQFLIGSWVSFYPFDVDSYEHQLDQMQEAGLNFNIFPMVFGGDTTTPEVCNKIEQEYAARNMFYLLNGGLNEDSAGLVLQLAKGKTRCIGYHLKDEPCGEELPEIGRVIRAYRAADGARYPFVNLFPSYAGETALGGSYYEYCSRLVREAGAENIEYLSHDFYPFRMDHTCLDLFADMEVIRRVALENGRLRTHAFPQASAWNGVRMPNIDEMRWNVYAYLTYGFKALSWFNLVCPGNSDEEGEGFRDSVIYRDGTIRDPELFENFARLNHEILTLGDTLMKLDTVHAYHTKKGIAGVEYLPSDWMITPVQGENFVISHMTARTGDQTYIMLFNNDWEKAVTASFRVSPFSGIEDLEYISPFDGSSDAVLLEDGVFTDTFRPGEGKLYKLNGKVSYRVISLDGTHHRAEVDLSAAQGLVGVDISSALDSDGIMAEVQISTNKRFTDERTVLYSFEEIPANGQLRFETTVGKYVRVHFSQKDNHSIQGLFGIRVRFADEPSEVTVQDEEPIPVTATEEVVSAQEVETVEYVEAVELDAVESMDVVEEVDRPEATDVPTNGVEDTAEVPAAAEEVVAPETEEAEAWDEPAVSLSEETVSDEVSVCEVDYSDLDEALTVVDGLVETEYSAESWKAVRDYYKVALSMKDGTHSQEEVTDAYWQLLDHVRELVPVQWTLPKPEATLPEQHHDKQSVHVTGGILTVAAVTVVGTVAGVFAGMFASKSKKRKKK